MTFETEIIALLGASTPIYAALWYLIQLGIANKTKIENLKEDNNYLQKEFQFLTQAMRELNDLKEEVMKTQNDVNELRNDVRGIQDNITSILRVQKRR